eukprot:3344653-Pleurochrysis_carterae.AAC.1
MPRVDGLCGWARRESDPFLFCALGCASRPRWPLSLCGAGHSASSASATLAVQPLRRWPLSLCNAGRSAATTLRARSCHGAASLSPSLHARTQIRPPLSFSPS